MHKHTHRTDDSLIIRCRYMINKVMNWHFIEHGVPIACPEVLQGPKTFTFSGANGACSEGTNSRIGYCASDRFTRMTFASCQSRGYKERGKQTLFVGLATVWNNALVPLSFIIIDLLILNYFLILQIYSKRLSKQLI